MFELTDNEVDAVVSQNVIPHKKYRSRGLASVSGDRTSKTSGDCCVGAESRIGCWTDCAGKAAYVGTGFQERYRAQGNPGG